MIKKQMTKLQGIEVKTVNNFKDTLSYCMYVLGYASCGSFDCIALILSKLSV